MTLNESNLNLEALRNHAEKQQAAATLRGDKKASEAWARVAMAYDKLINARRQATH